MRPPQVEPQISAIHAGAEHPGVAEAPGVDALPALALDWTGPTVSPGGEPAEGAILDLDDEPARPGHPAGRQAVWIRIDPSAEVGTAETQEQVGDGPVGGVRVGQIIEDIDHNRLVSCPVQQA